MRHFCRPSPRPPELVLVNHVLGCLQLAVCFVFTNRQRPSPGPQGRGVRAGPQGAPGVRAGLRRSSGGLLSVGQFAAAVRGLGGAPASLGAGDLDRDFSHWGTDRTGSLTEAGSWRTARPGVESAGGRQVHGGDGAVGPRARRAEGRPAGGALRAGPAPAPARRRPVKALAEHVLGDGSPLTGFRHALFMPQPAPDLGVGGRSRRSSRS